jgi:hypothetical protein
VAVKKMEMTMAARGERVTTATEMMAVTATAKAEAEATAEAVGASMSWAVMAWAVTTGRQR